MAADTKLTEEELIQQLQDSSEIRRVPLKALQIDRSYQRDPSQPLVDKIAEDLDAVSAELLLVSDRGEGGLWLVNGQHRSLAAMKRGLTEMDARVIFTGHLDDPGEIESKFRLRTNVRMSDKPLERFKAQLRSGNEESIAIVKILARYETELNDAGNPTNEYGINAVAAIEKLYRIDNGALLGETLQMIKDVFGVVGGKNASSAIMSAFAWFTLKHESEADYDRITDKLRLAGLAAIDRKGRTIAASMGGSLWMNYYRAMVEFYNERLTGSTRLEWRTKGAGSWKGTGERARGAVADH